MTESSQRDESNPSAGAPTRLTPAPAASPWAAPTAESTGNDSDKPWAQQYESSLPPAEFVAPTSPAVNAEARADTEASQDAPPPAQAPAEHALPPLESAPSVPVTPSPYAPEMAAPGVVSPYAPEMAAPGVASPYGVPPTTAPAPHTTGYPGDARPHGGYGVPYAAPPAPGMDPNSARRLSVTALWLALAALALGLALSWMTGSSYGKLISEFGFSPQQSQAEQQQVMEEFMRSPGGTQMSLGFMGQFIPTVMGILAIILGAISLKGPQKARGIWAIVLACLAPLICFCVFFGYAVMAAMAR